MKVHASAPIQVRRCPICDYPKAQFCFRIPDRFFGSVPGEFSLYRCGSCGLMFQPREELPEDLNRFYPEGYWWSDEGRIAPLERGYREWMVRNDQLRFVLQNVRMQPGTRLLDIGCGPGTFVKLAAEAGFDAFGLEASQEAAAIAGIECPGRIFYGNESTVSAATEPFEVLTLFHVLEHIPDPFPYVRSLRKLLKPKGRLIVQVPNVESFQARFLGSRWYGLDVPRHVVNYSPFSLMQLLGRAGYRIHGLGYYSLRDNAAALISSLFPCLDPMSQRVRRIREERSPDSLSVGVRQGFYLALLLFAQPFAYIEAALRRGATVKVVASLE